MLGSANLCKGCNADSSSFRRILEETQAERAGGYDSDEIDKILSSEIVICQALKSFEGQERLLHVPTAPPECACHRSARGSASDQLRLCQRNDHVLL